MTTKADWLASRCPASTPQTPSPDVAALIERLWDRLDDADAFEAAAMIERLTAERERLVRPVMDALWPILGGNHTSAEMWHEISDAIRAALTQTGEGE